MIDLIEVRPGQWAEQKRYDPLKPTLIEKIGFHFIFLSTIGCATVCGYAAYLRFFG